jgi:chromosome segregation ATPase
MSGLTVFLPLSALGVATVAVVWLARVRKGLSELGMRPLDSEDIVRIIEAAEKTASYESRMAGCEDRAERSENKLSEHEAKLAELTAGLGATEEIANNNRTGLSEVSEKTVSLKSRTAGCEDRAERSDNKLSEHGAKLNGLASKLEAVEQMLDDHATALAETNQSMKVVVDEIQSLEEFQTATEKTRDLVLAAFNDMQASMPPERFLGTKVDTADTGEISPEPEQGQEDRESQTDC